MTEIHFSQDFADRFESRVALARLEVVAYDDDPAKRVMALCAMVEEGDLKIPGVESPALVDLLRADLFREKGINLWETPPTAPAPGE